MGPGSGCRRQQNSLPGLQQLQREHPLSWTKPGRSHPKSLRPHPGGERSSSNPPASLRMAGFGARLCH